MAAMLCIVPIASWAQSLDAGAGATTLVTAGDQRSGTFKTINGDVTTVRGNSRSAATIGAAVRTGDVLVVGHKSSAAFTLRDGSVVTLGPNSSIEIKQFNFNPTTQNGNLLIWLARGSLLMKTGLIATHHPQQAKVLTPTAGVHAQGADFIVEQQP